MTNGSSYRVAVAQAGLSEFECWFFDVHGYVVLEGALTDAEVAELNALIDARGGLRAGAWLPVGDHFLDWEPPFRRLIAHPRVLPVIRELCGPTARLDSAYARDATEAAVHSGGDAFWGDTYYFTKNGTQHNGLTKALFALTDAHDGDGGFCCIPGSHKASFPTPASVTADHPVLRHVPLAAGDVVVFTDAIAHAGRRWVADRERRALFLSYTPGMLTWSDPVLLQQRFYDLLDDEEQRSVVRIPNVEHLMAPALGYEVPSIDELRRR